MAGKNRQVLIIAGEQDMSAMVSVALEKESLRLLSVRDAKAALDAIRSGEASMMLVEVKEPNEKGLEVLRKAKSLDPHLPVIVIAACDRYSGIVEAMKAGAYHCLVKPCDRQELIHVILRGLEEQKHRERLKVELAGHLPGDISLKEIMGPSDAVARLIWEVKCVTGSDLSVLIIGESGSGKEVIARAIHQAGPRSKAPFVLVDCGAIPETLLESELFGHEKGVFTDAKNHRIGKFELAQEGTLLLDEIFNMPLNSQVKLLRVLQEKKIYRVGGIKPLGVNVRILATSNQDIHDLALSGTFRRDLFYRLSEFTITVPALRERKEDILYLAKRFLDSTNIELNKHIKGFSEAALNLLLSYNWPGNVRQLRSVIRRASLLSDEMITEKDIEIRRPKPEGLTPGGQIQGTAWKGFPFKAIVQQKAAMVEREVLVQVLKTTRGNKARAARLLQVGYKTMQDKMKKLGIQELPSED